MTVPTVLGTLPLLPASTRSDLLAAPVRRVLADRPDLADLALVTEIDPGVSDTPTLVEAHAVPAGACANCVVVSGRREGVERIAACLVLATTRADVNGVVRRLLDVRKASFLPMERAVAESGMEYGGITPLGLPAHWRLLVDARVVAEQVAMIGSGVRRSKLVFPGPAFASFPRAEVVDDLAVPLG